MEIRGKARLGLKLADPDAPVRDVFLARLIRKLRSNPNRRVVRWVDAGRGRFPVVVVRAA